MNAKEVVEFNDKDEENMIEIVFSDSACGSLKMAQHCGEGEYLGGATSVFVSRADGSKPTEEEISAAQQEAEKTMQEEWETATPMGGNPADVYGFNYGLSVGDISENIPSEKRRQVLEWLYSVHPYFDDAPAFTDELMQKSKTVLKEICSRISTGESVRIWYSNQPDELCGMHWFMAQINQLDLRSGQVILVALPDYEPREDGTVITHAGWGGIKLGEWHRYTALQDAATLAFCKGCASHWQSLQQENAPLRAMLNGRLVSMPETLYDEFIISEIGAEENEFHEAMIVGRVLGKHELGIGDAWIAHRIEKMISAGKLLPITESAPDSPIYHRWLKKL